MRRLSLLLIFLSLALTACGQSKPTNYYLLKSTAVPVAAESMPRTTLGIVGVNLPGYLDRAGIVLLDENGTLINVPQFNRWAESLDEGAARLLRRSLTPVLLRQGITVLASEDTRVAAAYGVIVDIVRLEATTGGSIALEARWTLIDPGANGYSAAEVSPETKKSACPKSAAAKCSTLSWQAKAASWNASAQTSAGASLPLRRAAADRNRHQQHKRMQGKPGHPFFVSGRSRENADFYFFPLKSSVMTRYCLLRPAERNTIFRGAVDTGRRKCISIDNFIYLDCFRIYEIAQNKREVSSWRFSPERKH